MKPNNIKKTGINHNTLRGDQSSNKPNTKVSRYQHIYNSRSWKWARKKAFEANPLCEACESKGRIREATTINHIIPLRQIVDPSKPIAEFTKSEKQLIFGFENLESLCHPCHGQIENKMIKEERQAKLEIEAQIEKEKRYQSKKANIAKREQLAREDNFVHTICIDENGKPIKMSIF